MRNLVYKNLTSAAKNRRIISTTEVANTQGVHSVIHRHFVYLVRQVAASGERVPPQVQVVKERNNRLQQERFYCKIKGAVFAERDGRMYKVAFIHSLHIMLQAGTVVHREFNKNNS